MISPRQFISRMFEGPPDDDTQIGDDVTVVDSGKSYTGKVAEIDPKDPQHKVKVSFSGARPPKPDFKPDELRRDDPKKVKLPKPYTPPVAGGATGSFL